jgi:hypothetical protein
MTSIRPGDQRAADPRGASHATPWQRPEPDNAAEEAARISGHAGDEDLDPAERAPVSQREFALAEEHLIKGAKTSRGRADPGWHALTSENKVATPTVAYSAADREDSLELLEADR